MTAKNAVLGPHRGALAGPDIELRPMRWWHLSDVLVIEGASFGAEAWSPETYWSELAERHTRRYLVAHETGASAVIGYVGISVVADQADVQTIAVDPAVRGRGAGRTLLRCGLVEAAAAGARRIHLEVRADNIAAIELYVAEGFRRLGRRKGYYRDSRGGGVDAVMMSRDLVPDQRLHRETAS